MYDDVRCTDMYGDIQNVQGYKRLSRMYKDLWGCIRMYEDV